MTVSSTRRRLPRSAIHTRQRLGRRRIVKPTQALVVDVGERSVDGPEDVGERDVVAGRAGRIRRPDHAWSERVRPA